MQHQKSEKKKVVVTLCRVFPVTHSLAGKPTEFEGKLKEHKKIHTIRYNKNGVWCACVSCFQGGLIWIRNVRLSELRSVGLRLSDWANISVLQRVMRFTLALLAMYLE